MGWSSVGPLLTVVVACGTMLVARPMRSHRRAACCVVSGNGYVQPGGRLSSVPWRKTSVSLFCAAFLLLFFLSSIAQAQTCEDWKSVKGWQGTYTLSASGQFIHGIIDKYTINESTIATVSMTNQTGGLCDQLRWQGPDLSNGGSANDSTQIMNGCEQGQYFTYDTLIGNAGYPSNSEIVIDATHGTFSSSRSRASFRTTPSTTATADSSHRTFSGRRRRPTTGR
jgi:hypothetical protein